MKTLITLITTLMVFGVKVSSRLLAENEDQKENAALVNIKLLRRI